MATFVEYELEDGKTFLVQIQEPEEGAIMPASNTRRSNDGNVILKAGQKFSEALDSIKGQAAALRQKLDDLKADEVEVKFSLTASGEAGNFAIGNVKAEAAYEVTLKWKNEPALANR